MIDKAVLTLSVCRKHLNQGLDNTSMASKELTLSDHNVDYFECNNATLLMQQYEGLKKLE